MSDADDIHFGSESVSDIARPAEQVVKLTQHGTPGSRPPELALRKDRNHNSRRVAGFTQDVSVG